MKVDIERILIPNRGKTFYLFTNQDGKSWLMPKHHLRTALMLYQPSSWKGKILKKVLSIPIMAMLVRYMLHIEPQRCELKEDINNLLCELFETNKLDFSIFFGTPSIHQKMTIQLSKDNKILGYCKVTEQIEVWNNFKREFLFLDDLYKKGIRDIPQGLYCEKRGDGICIFVQSTTKSLKSRYPHKWLSVHERFLAHLNDKTKQKLQFEETDFYSAFVFLKHRLDWLNEKDNETVKKALKYIKSVFANKVVEFSVFHGDFTPWNMFMEKGHLFVFDWEYAMRTCPPGLDKYHFFIQTQIFEQHHNIDKIWKNYLNQHTIRNNTYFLCYFLLIISFYVKRSDTKEIFNAEPNIPIWIGLISKLIETL